MGGGWGQNLACLQKVNIKLCALQCALLFVLIRDGLDVASTGWWYGGDDGIIDILSKTMFKLTGKISGMVPEPADERQAAEDDLALWRPHACCLCPPGLVFLLAGMPSSLKSRSGVNPDLENGPKWKQLMTLAHENSQFISCQHFALIF